MSLKKVEIKKFLNESDLLWNLNEDVNILIGINGSGKTILTYLIFECFLDYKTDMQDRWTESMLIILTNNTNKNNIDFLQQESINTSKLKEPILLNSFKELRHLVLFCTIVNRFFEKSNKKIVRNKHTKSLCIKLKNKQIEIEELSKGEKNLLNILFTIYLQKKEPYIFLANNIDNTLDIIWQQNLIQSIRELNPNCQIIITTHSPSIWGKGWGDKLFFLYKLLN